MIDLDWPEDLAPYRVSFYLQPHVGGSESPITRTRKTYGLSAPRWVCRMSFRGGYDGIDGAEAFGPRLDALIAEMEGGLNRVRLWDFRRPYPNGLRRYYSQFTGETYPFTGGETFDLGEEFVIPAEAEPTNETAAAGATQMTFVGFIPGEIVFRPGDYIGGDGRPHIVTNVSIADGGGRAGVLFRPPLATTLLAGEARTNRASGWFQVTSDDAGENDTDVGGLSGYSLEFREHLP